MNSWKHHFRCCLLFFIYYLIIVFWNLRSEAFPYQAGWPETISGDIYNSPTVVDLDNDGYKEIVLASENPLTIYVYRYTGVIYNESWPKTLARNTGSAITVADIDNDSDMEIIVGSDYIYAWHHTGEIVNGFPIIASDGYITTSPAVGDITGDGIPEIAAGVSNCRFYIWDNQGNILNGFPKSFLAKDGGCGVIFSPCPSGKHV